MSINYQSTQPIAKRVRPASSFSYMKDYRIPKQQVYNDVRNSIIHTFNRRKSLNKQSKQIKQLIQPYLLSKQNNKKIDKLLIKYSLSLDFSRKKISNEDDDVDVEFIVKRYIKNCSKTKQKQQSHRQLKIDTNRYYSNTQDIPKKDFFQMESRQLKQLEDRQKMKNGYARLDNYKHPYMKIYNHTQIQTVNLINNGKQLSFDNCVLSIPEPQEWQKNHKKFRSTYAGIKTMRMREASKEKDKKRKIDVRQFIIS